MEAFVIVLVYAIVAAIAYRRRDRAVDGAEASLCLTCVHAMVTRGTGGQEWVACTYGGGVRRVGFTGCECTCYRSTQSTGGLVRIEGFAREAREVYAEVAIR